MKFYTAIYASVYTELREQFENAKIEEVKNIPVNNILDPARPAARKKISRKRMMIVLTSVVLSFLSAVGYFVIRHQYGLQITAMMGRFHTVKDQYNAAQ